MKASDRITIESLRREDQDRGGAYALLSEIRQEQESAAAALKFARMGQGSNMKPESYDYCECCGKTAAEAELHLFAPVFLCGPCFETYNDELV